MTSWETVYDKFFDKIEKDADFFSYYNVEPSEAVEIAKTRARNYLNEAVTTLTLNCTPQIDFNAYSEEVFEETLTPTEIDLLANLMREHYFEKDFSKLKAFERTFGIKDLNAFSPAAERKSFVEMFETIVNQNRNLIQKYASRDRITGKLKTIDYSLYSGS